VKVAPSTVVRKDGGLVWASERAVRPMKPGNAG